MLSLSQTVCHTFIFVKAIQNAFYSTVTLLWPSDKRITFQKSIVVPIYLFGIEKSLWIFRNAELNVPVEDLLTI